MSVTPGPVCSSQAPFGDSMSTSIGDYFETDGDTIRVCTQRSPNSTDSGYPGEFCFGSETVLGITTYYLYYCVSSNNWVRQAFNAY